MITTGDKDDDEDDAIVGAAAKADDDVLLLLLVGRLGHITQVKDSPADPEISLSHSRITSIWCLYVNYI